MFASRWPRLICVEPREVPPLPAEQLDRRHPADVLLQEGVDPRDPGPDRAVRLADVAAEPLRHQHDQRQHREGHQRQPPVERQHDDHDADEREHVAEHRHDAGGEQVVQHVDVGRHARHQPADGVAVVELDVEPLQVPVDLHPQVEHDPLAGQLHRERLHVLARERAEEDGRGIPAPSGSGPPGPRRRCTCRWRA